MSKNLTRNWQFDMAICIDRAGKRSTSGSTFVQGLGLDQGSSGSPRLSRPFLHRDVVVGSSGRPWRSQFVPKPIKALCKSLEDRNIKEFGDLQRAMMNHLSKNDAMPPIFINSLRKRINL